MTRTTIREVTGEELVEIVHPLPAYAFRSSPPLVDKLDRAEAVKRREGDRYIAAFEGDTVIACAASAPLTQNVRGKLFGMAGIHDVTTDPTARRQGYAKRVLKHLYAAVREEGRSLSCLYPFRESFYERLGYVNFPQPRSAKFAPAPLQHLLERDLGGSVDRVLLADGYDVFRNYMVKIRPLVHGLAVFDYYDSIGPKRSNYWLAVARVAGEPVGLMVYDLKGDNITQFTMRAPFFYYHTSRGKYLLLAWIARHIDQACQIELLLSPAEQPETWVEDLHVTVESAFIAPMGRVLDVAAMAGMRTGPGRFTARLRDPICPWNEGVWQFATENGALQVSRAADAECDLSMQAVSALVYGTQDPSDFALRGWGAPAPDVEQRMRSMFPPLLPYLHEHF